MMKKRVVDCNKRGQISIFIIIGIVLLIASVTIFYIVYKPSPEEAAELPEYFEQIPSEFRPIASLVQQCLYDTSVRGLEEIGKHGGYLSPDDITNSYNIMEPTESSGFRVFPNDPMTTIPYWSYFKSSNECKEECSCSDNKPSLYKENSKDSIESQMNEYIEENLAKCLRDFKNFADRGIDIQTGDPTSDIRIRQSDITVSLNYPITTKREDVESQMDEFYVTIPLNLRRIYELADEITQNENKYNYLERWAIELVEAASLGPREDGMPPSVASIFDPGQSPLYWSKTKSRDLLVNNILTPNIPLFQIWGTINYQNRPGLYQKTTLPIQSPTNTSYNDLAVYFEYLPLWPIYYDISGRGVRGDIIGPEKGFISYFSFMGIHRYYLYHDISFPVKIDIYDPTALNNKGYHFIFALEANIRDNKPLNCSGEGPETMAPPVASLMCHDTQSCADVEIIAVDEITGKPVEEVMLIYGAGEESCIVGITKSELGRTLGTSADAKLPSCIGSGCTLSAIKQGYFSEPQIFAVRCDDSYACEAENVLCNGETAFINITKIKSLNATVLKKPMLKSFTPSENPWEFVNEARPLLPDESVIVNLEKIKENSAEEDLSVSFFVDGKNKTAEIYPGLVPGRYNVNINLLYSLPDVTGRAFIFFQAIEECGAGGSDCFTLGPYTFNDTFIEGGAQYEFEITHEDLLNDNVTFYALSVPDSATFNQLDFNDIEMVGKSGELSKKYVSALTPKFES